MGVPRCQLHHELRGELRAGMHQVFGEVHVATGRQTRVLLFGLLAANATLVSVAFAATRPA